MTMPAILSALIGAGGAIGGSILGRGRDKETPIQGQQRELIDELLASLKGNGQFSDLFNVDEGAFQKSFIDPMKQRFASQTAPQIQQKFISSGQQRGTGLDDTLTRAGVDMDQLLNQYYFAAQQQAQNRQLGAMGKILGQGAGATPGQSAGQSAQQGLAGYGAGGFGGDIGDILNSIRNRDKKPYSRPSGITGVTDTFVRKGFENN